MKKNKEIINIPADGIETPQKNLLEGTGVPGQVEKEIMPANVAEAKEFLSGLEIPPVDNRISKLIQKGEGLIPGVSAFKSQEITEINIVETGHIVICINNILDQIALTVAANTATDKLTGQQLETRANYIKKFVKVEKIAELFGEGIEKIIFTDPADYVNAFEGTFEHFNTVKKAEKAQKIVDTYEAKIAKKALKDVKKADEVKE